MRKERGKIKEVKEGIALVEVLPEGSCEGCGAREICRLGMSGKRRVEVINTKGAKIGDEVEFVITGRRSLLASFLLYILPIASFFIGVGVGEILWHKESLSILLGFMGFISVFVILKLLEKRMRGRLLPYISQILSRG